MSTPTTNLTVATTVWVLSGIVLAQTPTPGLDRSPHESKDNPPVSFEPSPKEGTTLGLEDIDRQIRAMQQMHQEIQAAQTAAERAKLMERHRKLMQESMSMMIQIRGEAHGMTGMSDLRGMRDMHQSMELRMAMMEQMMQMMIDRETANPGKRSQP